MKFTKFIFLAFYSIIANAQGHEDICSEVIYNHILDLSGSPMKSEYVLYFDTKSSREIQNLDFKARPIRQTELTEDQLGSRKMSTKHDVDFVSSKRPNEYYKTSSGFYFVDGIVSEGLVVKEDPNLWQWKIHADTKQIAGLLSTKATVDFRGRKYTVWFTNEIPVPFGPWKLHGAPGLILYAADDDKVLQIEAKKIILNASSCKELYNNVEFYDDAMDMDKYLLEIRKITHNFAVKSLRRSGVPASEIPSICLDCPLSGLELFEFDQNR